MARQAKLKIPQEPVLFPDSSRYFRTTWMLDVRQTLLINELTAYVRFLDAVEVTKIQELIRRRNVFARHSWENNFYLKRISEFSDKSIIEVIRPGDPDTMLREAESIASIIESVLLITTVLYASREEIQTRLAVTKHRREVVDFVIGPGFNYLRTSSKRVHSVKGVTIDDRFCRRFQRLRLERLIVEASHQQEIGLRLQQTVRWLLESRLEPSFPAAVVKTAIALESLLGGQENEPLSRTLSERIAFLLSDHAEKRAQISKLLRDFYDARSRVVHGNRKKSRLPSSRLLEAADRLALLSMITVAANVSVFQSFDALTKWIEQQKWGHKFVARSSVQRWRPEAGSKP